MSEVKFACPVCGQHITTDSRTSGSHIECPTCFRKMVVPNPSEGETKLVLSAAEVAADLPAQHTPQRRRKRRFPYWVAKAWSVVSVLLVLSAGAAALYWYQGRVRRTLPSSSAESNQVAETKPAPTVLARWSLAPENAVFPHYSASGSVQGRRFEVDRATLRGSTLSLRQGPDWPPEISLTIVLLQEPSSGEIIAALPGAQVPTPRVVVRWKEAHGQLRRHNYRSGYLLKLALDAAQDGRRQGRIYLALPDPAHSYIAGEFLAEVLPPWAPRTEAARQE
jgi:hypothetical protein